MNKFKFIAVLALTSILAACGDDGGGAAVPQVISPAPTVTTDVASGVTPNQATLGGTVGSDGGDTVIDVGVYWHTAPGAEAGTKVPMTIPSPITNPFTGNIAGLLPATTYYFKAYATNSIGETIAANELQFTTLSATTVVDKSDLNHDLLIDSSDLSIFSTNYLETYWGAVDWCLFHESTLTGLQFEDRNTKYYLQNFKQLLLFINNYYACGGNDPLPKALQLESTPRFLARIADAVNIGSDYYITDPMAGSLFIYDANLVLKAEIKGLSKPLGVAIDTQGYILIGNNGRDNIEVYDPANGNLLAVFGEGLLKMPTAITLDSLGNIYVTDSQSHHIQVFDAAYNPIRVIGKSGSQGALNFPVDAKIVNGITNSQEIFVADQGNKRIQVYDLDGNWLRNFTFDGVDGQNCNWMTGVCEIPGVQPFTKVQALDTDSLGRLHVLDSHAASVMMFNPADGVFLGSYGTYGVGAGFLRLPMDVLVADINMAIVTSGDGGRIEVLTVP